MRENDEKWENGGKIDWYLRRLPVASLEGMRNVFWIYENLWIGNIAFTSTGTID
jgi:hypothetical protein